MRASQRQRNKDSQLSGQRRGGTGKREPEAPAFVPPSHTARTHQKNGRPGRPNRDYLDYSGFAVSAATLIFVVWYTLLTGTLTTNSNKQTEASTRAWIAPYLITFAAPLSGSNPFVGIVVHYKNIGKTPAKRIAFLFGDIGVATIQHRVVENSIIDDPTGLIPANTACEPGSTVKMRVPGGPVIYPNIPDPYDVDFTTSQFMSDIPDLIAHNKTLWVNGCIVYKTLGEVRKSGFCMYYHPDGRFHFCPEGNFTE
jgi:hypothetical protein